MLRGFSHSALSEKAGPRVFLILMTPGLTTSFPLRSLLPRSYKQIHTRRSDAHAHLWKSEEPRRDRLASAALAVVRWSDTPNELAS